MKNQRKSPDKLKAPLIALSILLFFCGLWIFLRTWELPSEPTWDDEEPETIIDRIQGKKQASKRIRLGYDGNKISVSVPRNKDGTPAVPRAILVDADSLDIIWEYHGNDPGQLASVTKLMLMYYAYALIDSGIISLDDTVYVTDEAPLMGGSQAYLDRGERYTIEELLKALAIGSANDAAYLLGQHLGDGSIIATIRNMNRMGRELGLTRTRFYNVHGLPPARGSAKVRVEDGIIIQRYKRRNIVVATKPNIGTASDMAKLSLAYLNFDDALKWASSRRDSVWDIDRKRHGGAYMLNTHFKILGKKGIDGIKTGYTAQAGWCVAATAKRGNRRLIAVVLNAKTQNIRDSFVERLFDAGWEYIKPDTSSSDIGSAPSKQ